MLNVNKPGIYRIMNTATGCTYIGSSTRPHIRLKHHRTSLKRGLHSNLHLQSSWNKHGSKVFVFERLCECKIEKLQETEQRFIDAHFENGLPLYNKMASANSRAGFRYVPTPEVIAQLRARFRGIPLSAEHRANVSAALKGRPHSAEWNAKVGNFHRGRKRSPEICARITLAQLQRGPMSIATRNKMSASHTGVPLLPEHKAKVLASIAAIAASRRGMPGRKHYAETKEKIRKATTAYWERWRAERGLKGKTFKVSVDTKEQK